MTDPTTLRWDRIAAYAHELTLKGGNRRHFQRKLAHNAQRVLAPLGGTVHVHHDRLEITAAPERIAENLEAVSRVFGIAVAIPVQVVEPTLDRMAEAATALYRELSPDGSATFAVRVRRPEKAYPMKSQELQRELGARIVRATGAPVRLKDPDVLLQFRVHADRALLEGPRRNGPGGLPMGVTGRVLTLFSGGIDSPAAAWLMLRRGCQTDFVHFHVYANAQQVAGTKIPRLARAVLAPQGAKARLFLLPYHAFQMATLSHPIPPPLELVLFRRFMVRTAGQLAEQHKLKALVTGDNLAQVASQTLENLAALEGVTPLPVFRPVLGFDKKEIIELAQRAGTYDPSIERYKDCCSLVAKRPETKPSMKSVLRAESRLPIEQLTADTLAQAEVLEV